MTARSVVNRSRCSRCGAEMRPFGELAKLARAIAGKVRDVGSRGYAPSLLDDLEKDALRLTAALACHARRCDRPVRPQRQWKISARARS